MKRVRMIVRGGVQGVGFRWATERQANRLGLGGYVRNLQTAEVEIVAEGDAAAVDRLIEWARHGPPAARVVGLEVIEEASTGLTGEFAIRY